MKRSVLIRLLFIALLFALILLFIKGPFYHYDTQKQIIVSDADVAQIFNRFQRTWQRPPTPPELRNELQSFIRNELLYQEALRLGYDKNDMVIRNALIRKMEFLAESQAEDKEISDADISAYFNLRQEKYRLPPLVSFSHIYFNLDKRGPKVESEITGVINNLNNLPFDNASQQIMTIGDRFMLDHHFTQKSQLEIRNLFGGEFAEQLPTLPLQTWSGPVASGYGLHAVYVAEVIQSRIPDLSEIKYKVLNDMVLEEKAAARDQFYTELMRQYQIMYQGSVQEILNESSEN